MSSHTKLTTRIESLQSILNQQHQQHQQHHQQKQHQDGYMHSITQCGWRVPPKRPLPSLPPRKMNRGVSTTELARIARMDDQIKCRIPQLQAIIRARIARKKFTAIWKMKCRRDMIVKEILSSEQIYVDNINILNQIFLGPLVKSGLIEKEDALKPVINSIPVIIGVNTRLLKDLENRLKIWSSTCILSDIFLLMSEFLKTYTQYVNNYSSAINTFVSLSEKKTFIEWEKGLDTSKCKGLMLKDYLILPVQRLPRYRMLLEDLVKNTWKTHNDYEKLCNALSKVLQVAGFVNSSKGVSETTSRVLTIAESVANLPEDFVAPWRRFVKEGSVSIDGKQMQLFLFNDLLVVAKQKKNSKLRFTLMIDLSGTSTCLHDTGSSDFGFIIFEGSEKLFVSVKTKEERQEWMDALACTVKSREVLQAPVTPRRKLHRSGSSTNVHAVSEGDKKGQMKRVNSAKQILMQSPDADTKKAKATRRMSNANLSQSLRAMVGRKGKEVCKQSDSGEEDDSGSDATVLRKPSSSISFQDSSMLAHTCPPPLLLSNISPSCSFDESPPESPMPRTFGKMASLKINSVPRNDSASSISEAFPNFCLSPEPQDSRKKKGSFLKFITPRKRDTPTTGKKLAEGK
eukprot:TRINITY_DN6432_c0_g1_i1.p1 TRINITY_DN6432_c0_g1~~TRINITY_DN6432_c0_g1_i1.p1  ORF type:complete len:628 (+),score=173.94 TRINITY_DN6432_c0_g1_i1:1859-3742(+)